MSADRILIVDDEPVILQILKAVFEDEPYRLSMANSGHEALDLMEREGGKIFPPGGISLAQRDPN